MEWPDDFRYKNLFQPITSYFWLIGFHITLLYPSPPPHCLLLALSPSHQIQIFKSIMILLGITCILILYNTYTGNLIVQLDSRWYHKMYNTTKRIFQFFLIGLHMKMWKGFQLTKLFSGTMHSLNLLPLADLVLNIK
jgi:hypothetical protein